MRKGVKVKQLNREVSHRKLMLKNLVADLLYHEQIQSTVARAKVTRQIAEKLITRARKNLLEGASEAQKLHNVRQAARIVRDKEVLHKLFNDIAYRYQTRNGGYTRVLKSGRRKSDAAEMAIVELVEKKELVQLKDERKAFRESLKKKKDAPAKTAKK